jgi:hypothetical protein
VLRRYVGRMTCGYYRCSCVVIRFNTDIKKGWRWCAQLGAVGLTSPEEYDAELERMNVAMMAENQALQYDNKQLNTLIKEYETTLETVMGLFRQRAVRLSSPPHVHLVSRSRRLESLRSSFLMSVLRRFISLSGGVHAHASLFAFLLARGPISRTNTHPRIRIPHSRTRDRSSICATRCTNGLLGLSHTRLGAPTQCAPRIRRRDRGW